MGNETTFSKRNVLSFLEKSCSEQDPEYVDMAIFLSGGLDSTGLAHFYSRMHGSKLKTLTVNFGGGNKDEVRLAEKYARSIQSDHSTIDVTYENVLETLVSVTKNFGQPIADAAIIPLCIMCKSLPSNIKVVIQGDGGDEVFGGYKYYKRLYLAKISLSLKPILLLFMMLKKDSIVHRKLRSIYAIVLNSGIERFARIYSNLLAWEKVSTFVTVPVDESVFTRRYETLEKARMLIPLDIVTHLGAITALPQWSLQVAQKVAAQIIEMTHVKTALHSRQLCEKTLLVCQRPVRLVGKAL
jgi:hypothetical protein